ncbi:hypothetical protein SAMN05443144_113152 [Fodinibius roseus]|uniref:Macrophage migration inhibitory factor (MIF) n=1 Tax=Fodinibius roseus TaxID=1194090 RepID=A0A1M5ESI4_9BACT|nr:hypothetical protein [Fodinibius roseus]SHF82147.1 hypothetical protein SAMN05443144_113152 [Fodinibius roseus]
MPIANCFIKDKHVSQQELQELTERWAEQVNVDIKDICLTFIPNCMQGGQQYDVLVNLYLPSLWDQDNIKQIQKSLLNILKGFFGTEASEIFIMTSIIRSGHVVEDGEIVEW